MTTKKVLNAQADFALDKFIEIPIEERGDLTEYCDKLHEHYKAHNYHPEPGLADKLELLLMVGTWLNEHEYLGS